MEKEAIASRIVDINNQDNNPETLPTGVAYSLCTLTAETKKRRAGRVVWKQTDPEPQIEPYLNGLETTSRPSWPDTSRFGSLRGLLTALSVSSLE